MLIWYLIFSQILHFNIHAFFNNRASWSRSRTCQNGCRKKALHWLTVRLTQRLQPVWLKTHWKSKYFHRSDQKWCRVAHNIGGLVQDCSNSSALAMELLQSCTKPSMYIEFWWIRSCQMLVGFLMSHQATIWHVIHHTVYTYISLWDKMQQISHSCVSAVLCNWIEQKYVSIFKENGRTFHHKDLISAERVNIHPCKHALTCPNFARTSTVVVSGSGPFKTGFSMFTDIKKNQFPSVSQHIIFQHQQWDGGDSQGRGFEVCGS